VILVADCLFHCRSCRGFGTYSLTICPKFCLKHRHFRQISDLSGRVYPHYFDQWFFRLKARFIRAIESFRPLDGRTLRTTTIKKISSIDAKPKEESNLVATNHRPSTLTWKNEGGASLEPPAVKTSLSQRIPGLRNHSLIKSPANEKQNLANAVRSGRELASDPPPKEIPAEREGQRSWFKINASRNRFRRSDPVGRDRGRQIENRGTALFAGAANRGAIFREAMTKISPSQPTNRPSGFRQSEASRGSRKHPG